MARIIVSLCDLHPDDEEVRGETFVVSVPTLPDPRAIDLCPEHRKEILDPLVEVLTAHGAPPEAGPSLPPPKRKQARNASTKLEDGTTAYADGEIVQVIPCPACDFVLTGPQSLGGHLLAIHDFDIGSRPGRKYFGDMCPLCGTGPHARLGQTHAVLEHPEIRGGASALFEEARRRGDPHKIVAKQTKKLRDMIRKGAGSYVEA